MSVDWSRTLLLWDPDDERLFGFSAREVQARGIATFKTSYRRIGADPALVEEIEKRRPDAIIFTRNDEMPGNPRIGKLLAQCGTGYTSISAIDAEHQVEETGLCFADILAGNAAVSIEPPRPLPVPETDSQGTFSLIFDFEQFGGARFGMPRLLPLIESNGVRATFFVTGFMSAVYPGVVHRISDGGHEIGIHGSMHEFLQGRSLDEQTERVRTHACDLAAFGKTAGANFIFRMDGLSPEALARTGLTYFVLFRKHLFYRTRIIPASTRSRPFRTPSGDLTLVPVSVETYGLDAPAIKPMIDSAWRTARQEKTNHISVLMHPFKDGSIGRLPITRWVVEYLTRGLRLRSIPLSELPQPAQAPPDSVEVLYRWDGFPSGRHDRTVANGRSASWWVPPIYHSRRVENLIDELHGMGAPGILSSDPAAGKKKLSVFPDTLTAPAATCRTDPILAPRKAAEATARMLSTGRSASVEPPGFAKDLLNCLLFHLPRTFEDVRMVVPKLRAKARRIL